jgi:death on curing protein
MTAPEFLTLEEVLAIHADQIARYGGSGGIRDIALLESAIAMPRMTFGEKYLHPTLHEMAAAYLFHLVQNHPFLDGNKRVGLSAALAFLGLNGLWLAASPELEDEVVELVMQIARGEAGKPDAAIFFRRRSIAFGRSRR